MSRVLSWASRGLFLPLSLSVVILPANLCGQEAALGADPWLLPGILTLPLSALEEARNRPEVDSNRVFLLGHSLGGVMAPEIGRRDEGLAGVAILAAPARYFFEVLTSQLDSGDRRVTQRHGLGLAAL